MDTLLSKFLELVSAVIGKSLQTEIEEPYAPTGIWFVDLRSHTSHLVVQYSKSKQFGISTLTDEWEHRPDEIYDDWIVAATRAIELLRTKGNTIPTATLTSLRGNQTQAQIATAMCIKQPSYAKIEKSSLATAKLETLQKVVGALNGKLHLIVEQSDGRCFLLGDTLNSLSAVVANEYAREPYNLRTPCAPPVHLIATKSFKFKYSDNFQKLSR